MNSPDLKSGHGAFLDGLAAATPVDAAARAFYEDASTTPCEGVRSKSNLGAALAAAGVELSADALAYTNQGETQ